ncbi:MAG: sugar transferase [Planctomycetia bacterium]|nr:sugar transferase [Planctomycetia bacterium]
MYTATWYHPLKTVLDTLLASLLLLLTAPIILLLIGLVRLTSEGPGIYSQVRMGRGGRRYAIYKIRSMAHNCELKSGPQWSLAGDPRVTPLGRFLRKSHLDELPQLYNVLRGDMSLVGPRPERPEFVEKLEKAIPNYRTRLEVRPGITGLAQVQLPPDEHFDGVVRKVACDAVYVTSVSLWLDLRILAGTALKIAGVPFHVTSRVLMLPGVLDSSRPEDATADREQEPVPNLLTA